jgi:hypothetical protein
MQSNSTQATTNITPYIFNDLETATQASVAARRKGDKISAKLLSLAAKMQKITAAFDEAWGWNTARKDLMPASDNMGFGVAKGINEGMPHLIRLIRR